MTEETRKDGSGQAERERIVALAQLDLIAYDRQRVGAATAMGVRVSTLDKVVAKQRASLAKERIVSKEQSDLDQLAASAKIMGCNGVTEESSGESLATPHAVLIDTANLLILIAGEMIAGSFNSLPGPYCQTQALVLMAISRGLLETSELGDEEEGVE